MKLDIKIGILCIVFMGSVSSVVIAYLISNEMHSFDWIALVDQIKKDPVVLESCSRELSNFNSNAAELLLKHSNLASISDAKLAINFELNQGIRYISVGLEGLKGIHLDLSSNDHPIDPSFGQQTHENVQHKYFFRK